jgi:hypothetical protein
MTQAVHRSRGLNRPERFRKGGSTVLVASLLGICGAANASDIPTGNENLQIRWDNTLRYSYAKRMKNQDPLLLVNPNSDDGDRNFDKGTVGNRLDLLSELDFVYKKDWGFRVSGAAWYDAAYRGTLAGTNAATTNHLSNGLPDPGKLNDSAQHWYYHGAEFQDAFIFGKFDLGAMPVSFKAGRHTVYWGESLMGGGAIHGISYGQAPLDIAKGLMLPGVEAKELFRPLTQFSLQAQPTPKLTLLAQCFFQWDSYRLPEGGTYLGFLDPIQRSGESLVAGPNQRLLRGLDSDPKKSPESYGVGLKYSPDWLDGTVGLYYRRFSDMQPQMAVRPTAATLPAALNAAWTGLGYVAVSPVVNGMATYAFSPAYIPGLLQGQVGNYYMAYGKGVDLAGISLSKTVLGTSLGAEFSYRWRMPLVSNPVTILPAPLVTTLASVGVKQPGVITAVPVDGDTPGARGNTMHGLVNLLGVTGKTPLYDTSSWMVEVVWNRLDCVNQNSTALKMARSGYTLIDAGTKEFYGAGLSFTPTWFQVLPGLDLTMPLAYSVGLSGNSVVSSGGNKNSGSWGAGFGLDFLTAYKFDIKYVGFFGDLGSDPLHTPNGFGTAALRDRNMVTFTFTTKF